MFDTRSLESYGCDPSALFDVGMEPLYQANIGIRKRSALATTAEDLCIGGTTLLLSESAPLVNPLNPVHHRGSTLTGFVFSSPLIVRPRAGMDGTMAEIVWGGSTSTAKS